MSLLQNMGPYLWAAIIVALLGVVWTVRLFRRRRNFEAGPKKGVAANPAQVRRDNPPD